MATTTHTTFDQAAEAVAEAYAAGDEDGARRLYEVFHAKHLRPDMDRWLPWVVFDRNYQDDVYSRVLERVIVSLKAGKPIYKRFLATLYRRSAFDVIVRREGRHAAHREPVSDEQLLEDIIDRAANAGSLGDVADAAATSVDLARLRDTVREHLGTELRRPKPKWVELWLHMCEGITEGPALAELMGVTKVRARQLKKDVSDYLLGAGRHLLADVEDRDIEEEKS